MRRHWLAIVVRAFVLLGLAQPASAQPRREPTAAEVAEARAIFAEGVAHVDRGEWQEAVVSFRQVLEVREAPPVLYNLGAALYELRNYVEAEPLLTRVANDASADTALVERSRHLLEEIASRGGRVRIVLTGPLGGSTVWLDDVVLTSEQLATSLPVAAGAHVVSVRAGATEHVRRPFEVSAGQSLELPVVLGAVAEEAPVAGPIAEPSVSGAVPRDSSGEATSRRRRRIVIGAAAGGAALVAIVIIAVAAGGGRSGYEGDFTPGQVRF